MWGVAFAQVVLLFLCIFLYRFGSPTLFISEIVSVLTASMKLGKKTKQRVWEGAGKENETKGVRKSLSLSPHHFLEQKSTTPFTALSRAPYPSFHYPLTPFSFNTHTKTPLLLPLSLSLSGLEQALNSIGWLESHFCKSIYLTNSGEMALEALSSNDLLNFIIYETISATPYTCHAPLEAGFSLENPLKPQDLGGALDTPSTVMDPRCSMGPETSNRKQNLAVQGRKKRRRRARVCKNKEEAETQRMTHIAVERNRRRQMNEHLAILRSLMPESYVQRVCLLSLLPSYCRLYHFLLSSMLLPSVI